MNDTAQAQLVSRQELYRQVWEMPMIRLGEQYGISGNGLKKICRRLKIPFPPRGYWAKRWFGKSMKQMPLSEADEQTPKEVTITPTPPAPTPEILAPEVAEKPEKAHAISGLLNQTISLKSWCDRKVVCRP